MNSIFNREGSPANQPPPARRVTDRASRSRAYAYRLRISLAVVLVGTIAGFIAALHIPFHRERAPIPPVTTIAVVPEVVPTSQGRPAAAPSRPKIPIPVAAEDIPEMDPSEDLNLPFEEFRTDLGLGGVGNDRALSGSGTPRPIVEVIPDYPEKLRKQDITGTVQLGLLVNQDGVVDSAWVLLNTTHNRELANLAIDAALQSKYMPLASRGTLSLKVIRTYEFKSN